MKYNKGFSLPEILAAFTLLGILSLSVYTMTGNFRHRSGKLHTDSEIMHQCCNLIEILSILPGFPEKSFFSEKEISTLISEYGLDLSIPSGLKVKSVQFRNFLIFYLDVPLPGRTLHFTISRSQQ